MILYVTIKCPDVLENEIEKVCENEIGGPPDSEEHDIMFDELVQKTKRLCEKWFRYNELVTLKIDTENGTCTVEEN